EDAQYQDALPFHLFVGKHSHLSRISEPFFRIRLHCHEAACQQASIGYSRDISGLFMETLRVDNTMAGA
ncbi:MAG TPA: hypothetical protein VMU10_01855, partial [Desulfomonilia bacterium]|nr:hypothetical protein [Desulfomonilia bacterium]